jgi:hypothetical protein
MRLRPRTWSIERVKWLKPPEPRDIDQDLLQESSPSERDSLSRGLALLTTIFPVEAKERGSLRLARAVSELPLRYAPFFERLSDLWGVPEERVLRELTCAKDPRRWTLTLLPGVKTYELTPAPRAGQRSRLMCFTAGVRFPQHRHRGSERVLVLEGSYLDGSGRQVRAGEEQLMAGGSEHQLHVPGDRDCIAAIAEHGIEFTGPWLRWVNKLLS